MLMKRAAFERQNLAGKKMKIIEEERILSHLVGISCFPQCALSPGNDGGVLAPGQQAGCSCPFVPLPAWQGLARGAHWPEASLGGSESLFQMQSARVGSGTQLIHALSV